MKQYLILFDDTWYGIEIGEQELTLGRYEFSEALEILLTPKQYEQFVMECTNRIFYGSTKRVKKFIDFYNGVGNVWYKDLHGTRDTLKIEEL